MKGSYHAYSCDTKDRYLVHIYLIVISIGLAYLVQLAVGSFNREIPWWIGMPGIFGIYGILYLLYSKTLWKIQVVRTIFQIKTPHIYGKYSGTLKSSFDNFKAEKKVNIEIKQTWDRIHIDLRTESSQSYSQSCSIAIKDKDTPAITYNFLNEPNIGTTRTMEIHYGMCTLFLKDKKLTGEFFTGRGRQTFGSIEALKRHD